MLVFHVVLVVPNFEYMIKLYIIIKYKVVLVGLMKPCLN